MSFAHAIREVSCEGLAPAAQQSVPVPFSLLSPCLFPCSRGQAPVPAEHEPVPSPQQSVPVPFSLPFFPAAGDRHLFLRNTSQSPPDSQRRHGPPELVVRRKHSVIAMPVLPRRRDEIGEHSR